jgi:hypothetical protein
MDDVKPGKITGRRGHVREGHFRVAPATCGISVGGGRGWAIWRTVHEHVQAVQVGFREISLSHLSSMATPKHGKKLQHLQGRPAGNTADRAGRVYVSCKPKVHHDRRCVDTFPGQCFNGGP